MNVFVCKFDCTCHPAGTVVVSAFNRGHAVKKLGQRLKELGLNPEFDKKTHTVEELDLEAKKGSLIDHWIS